MGHSVRRAAAMKGVGLKGMARGLEGRRDKIVPKDELRQILAKGTPRFEHSRDEIKRK
jgi:hypothetical protein